MLLNKMLCGKYIAVKLLLMRRDNERFLICFFINNDFVCLVSNGSYTPTELKIETNSLHINKR